MDFGRAIIEVLRVSWFEVLGMFSGLDHIINDPL